MLSLEERIADRIRRGKENAEMAMPIDPKTGEREKPSAEDIASATNHTVINEKATAAKPSVAKAVVADWKPNA